MWNCFVIIVVDVVVVGFVIFVVDDIVVGSAIIVGVISVVGVVLDVIDATVLVLAVGVN